ncbi:TauD/TfdA family dioxygenase [Streptomyces sp. TRM S81-3]|uniref:TauD/TfdA family dioxygenase n=1 Tax=Streptomyces griseicoloratus TaxID=2752516 RepID=A0A926LC52_9ACTN|nr:TauD/TfdA family dioxygenase [Streptomyces griseicoloratus]MBD0423942.1 TauD/TfdA family dioxygenase [Streptomyces griseicoloratus]
MVTDTTWRPREVTPQGAGAEASPAGLLDLLGRLDLAELLTAEKALVFRGFGVTPGTHGSVVDALLPRRLAYVHGNSPRTKVGDNVYTSTEYPAEFVISMHNELSYASSWPTRLLFYCEQAPHTGGATPVVDGALWLRSLDAEVREAFTAGVRYVQNLHDGYGFGKSWQDTFETDDRSAVDAHLAGTGAEWTWTRDGTLRITHLRPATVRHPVTGAEVWFNQADQFHFAGLGEHGAQVREVLPEEELPQSVTFADGRAVPAEYIAHIQETGLKLAVDVDWAAGDLLLIDNVLVAHGRRPFTGRRRVLVAMSG